jgi:hypothetical protein
MKKLALSVVALMVAGAGVSVSSVGCSSSSSTGTSSGDDSGSLADVTTGDSGESETSTGEGGTDSGTPVEASCLTDASGTIEVDTPTADGGTVENTACEQCIATNCSAAQTTCIEDCNLVADGDASAPACGEYAVCVYSAFLTNLATSDAGLATDLSSAQTSCAGSFAPASIASGNALIGCIASSCASATAGCIPQ